MKKALRGCNLKLRRADQHRRRLAKLMERWLKTHPVSVTAYADSKTGEKVFRVNGPVPRPSARWSPIFGDYLYNLRSALDHLAWQLVIASGGTPTKQTAFPIYADCALFRKHGLRKLEGMSDQIQTAITGNQPCRRVANPTFDPLWWLEDLGNIDKHRHLNIIARAAHGGWFEPPLPAHLGLKIEPYIGLLELDTELLRLPPDQMHVNYIPVLDIALEAEPSPIKGSVRFLLTRLYKEVVITLQRYEKWF